MAARTLDSTNSEAIWDKFKICQGHRGHSPYIQLGTKRRKPDSLKVDNHRNALKQARQYQEFLSSGQADTRTELASLAGIPRTTISRYLALLNLTEEVRSEALLLPDSDPRIQVLTVTRLHRLLRVQKPAEQRRAFRALLDTVDVGAAR
jgi:hypothetical protein